MLSDAWFQEYDATQQRLPEMNSRVHVLWTDGGLYPGVFRGTREELKYTVVFEDRSELVLGSKHVYPVDDPLPPNVKSRVVS